jgi:Uma2 family endonuclease
MSAMPARHVITADRYELMVEAGAFKDDRVELMLGEIYDMSPIGSAHQACVDRLTELLGVTAVFKHAILRVQGSIRAGDLSQPQPDLALLRRRDDFYAAAHPEADDVLLVIEVADTSLRYDRDVKLPLYAACGVPEAWIVDLRAGAIEVATQPSGKGYGRVARAVPGDVLTPAAVTSVSVPVGRVLGSR